MSDNVAWNKQHWDDPERWRTEWHAGYAWGGREQVRKDFLRLVAPLLPDGRLARVLEIACGMGRFTELLLEVAEHVHSIDLAVHCVESCRARFPADRFEASVTDGMTLPSGRFDLVVSYDSLVHADLPVLQSYFSRSREVLVPGGYVAIHHANHQDFASSRMNVTAGEVFELIQALEGLEMVSQTVFRLTQGQFIDCFTVARRTN